MKKNPTPTTIPQLLPPPPTRRPRKKAISYRIQPTLIAALDDYADAQDPPISRTRALEHLLSWALTAAGHAPKAA